MNEARALILCKSTHHGNTRLVADRIASVLDAAVIDPTDAMTNTLGDYHLIGIGSGIYYGRFHRSIRNWLNALPMGIGQGHHAFVFSTSGLPFLSRVYHRPVVNLLRRKGFEVIGEFACRGHDTFGPLRLFGGLNRKHPNEQDLAGAERFASEITSIHSSRHAA